MKRSSWLYKISTLILDEHPDSLCKLVLGCSVTLVAVLGVLSPLGWLFVDTSSFEASQIALIFLNCVFIAMLISLMIYLLYLISELPDSMLWGKIKGFICIKLDWEEE